MELKWAFFQNENSMRRLKADLAAMMRDLTSKQIAMLDEHIAVHGLVKDTDGILHLSDEQVRGRILEAMQTQGSNIAVGDPQ
jgi:hypothetical protein